MTKVTVTVTDTDLSTGEYKVDFNAEGSQIEKGEATAAYFTGYYLYTLVNDDKFIADAAAFGRELIDNMQDNAETLCPAPLDPACARLTLQDKNLRTGRYAPSLDFSGGDPEGKHLPTSAQVVGLYMRALIGKAEFQRDCWAFADAMVAENDSAVIANAECSPANDDGNGAVATYG